MHLTWLVTSETVRVARRPLRRHGHAEHLERGRDRARHIGGRTQSVQDFLCVIGLVSLALALLNLLPVLPLDGGHIVMSILERVRGRAFSRSPTCATAPSG